MKSLIFILLFLPTLVFGQQFLWSTIKADSMDHIDAKYIPIENVKSEILKFYDFYDLYFDGTGFSKDGFVKTIESSNTIKTASISGWADVKKMIYKIEQPSVFAFKSNDGSGSYITVLSINGSNVDMFV